MYRYPDLERLAVSADRPPTATYQFRKFVRRHRALVGGSAATLLALVVGLVFALRFAHEAGRQEARARHIAALAQLRDLPADALAQQTTRNAEAVLGLK